MLHHQDQERSNSLRPGPSTISVAPCQNAALTSRQPSSLVTVALTASTSRAVASNQSRAHQIGVVARAMGYRTPVAG